MRLQWLSQKGLKCYLLLPHLHLEKAGRGRTQGWPEGQAARARLSSPVNWAWPRWLQIRDTKAQGIYRVTGRTKGRETPQVFLS